MNSNFPSRFDQLRKNIARIDSYREILRSQIADSESKTVQFKYSADLNQKCSEVFKQWLEDLLKINVDSISDLATNGLKHVIDDQSLTFRIKQELKYNRLSMKFVIEENEIEGDPMTSFGGGAVLVASFILRLAIMARMKMANLLLLDESMHALAIRYIPAAAEFMKHLSEQTGINILMVTHNEEFMSNAHTAYEGYATTSENGMKFFHLKRRTSR